MIRRDTEIIPEGVTEESQDVARDELRQAIREFLGPGTHQVTRLIITENIRPTLEALGRAGCSPGPIPAVGDPVSFVGRTVPCLAGGDVSFILVFNSGGESEAHAMYRDWPRSTDGRHARLYFLVHELTHVQQISGYRDIIDGWPLDEIVNPKTEEQTLAHLLHRLWWEYDATRRSTELGVANWGTDESGVLRVFRYARAIGWHDNLRRLLEQLPKLVRPELPAIYAQARNHLVLALHLWFCVMGVEDAGVQISRGYTETLAYARVLNPSAGLISLILRDLYANRTAPSVDRILDLGVPVIRPYGRLRILEG